VVLDLEPQALAAEQAWLGARVGGVPAEVIDCAAWQAVQRLVAAGIVGFAEQPGRILHDACPSAKPPLHSAPPPSFTAP